MRERRSVARQMRDAAETRVRQLSAQRVARFRWAWWAAGVTALAHVVMGVVR